MSSDRQVERSRWSNHEDIAHEASAQTATANTRSSAMPVVAGDAVPSVVIGAMSHM